MFVIEHALRKFMEGVVWLVYVVCVLGSAVASVWTVVLSQSARARAAMSVMSAVSTVGVPPAEADDGKKKNQWQPPEKK